MGIKHYEEKFPTQLESNPRLTHLEADGGPQHHRAAASLQYQPSVFALTLVVVAGLCPLLSTEEDCCVVKITHSDFVMFILL